MPVIYGMRKGRIDDMKESIKKRLKKGFTVITLIGMLALFV